MPSLEKRQNKYFFLTRERGNIGSALDCWEVLNFSGGSRNVFFLTNGLCIFKKQPCCDHGCQRCFSETCGLRFTQQLSKKAKNGHQIIVQRFMADWKAIAARRNFFLTRRAT